MTETFICPGCRVLIGEHRCHENCDCPDCRDNFGDFSGFGRRKCDCPSCYKNEVISKFLDAFQDKDREIIFEYLKFVEKLNVPKM